MKGPITTIARGDDSRITEPRRLVVRNEEDWRSLWAEHAGAGVSAPPVNFSDCLVAAVFAGERSVPGFDVEIVGSRRDGVALALLVEERRPATDGVAPQVLVTPFHIAAVQRYDGDVRFASSDVVEVAPPAVSPRPRRHSPSPSSTGLEPRVAGALAYVAGPFSGALLLAVESTSHFVRFHAWQALLGLGILGVLDVVCLGLAFLLLVVSPAAFWTMLWAAAILAAGWLLAWVACLLQAWRGYVWKLPLVGPYAERWSGVRGQ